MNDGASIVLCVLSLAGTAAAEPPVASSDAINRSIQETLDFIDGPWARGGFRVRYSKELRYRDPRLPDSPLTLDQSETDVAWHGESRRVSISPVGAADSNLDFAMQPESAWAMSKAGQHIFEPGRTPPSLQHIEQFRVQVSSDVAQVLFGTVQGLRESKFEWRERGDGRWHARTQRLIPDQSGLRVDVDWTVRWDSQHAAALLEEIRAEARRADTNQLVRSTTTTIEGWSFSPVVGRPVASTFTLVPNTGPDAGKPTQKVVVWSIEAATEDQVRDLVRRPSGDSPDPIRGPVAVQTVIDHRGEPTVQARMPDNTIKTIPLKDVPEPRGKRIVRSAGWVAIGCIVVLVVLLRWRGVRGA